jgi:hypothetical protein
VVWHALFDGALTGLSALEGSLGEADGEWLRTVIGLAVRVSAVSAGAALLGYAAGHIGRSTAGALGLGLGYVFALENVVGSNFKPLRPWMMFWDSTVFVKGQFVAGGDVPGRSTLEAGVVLLAYAIGVTLIAVCCFEPATLPDRQPGGVEHRRTYRRRGALNRPIREPRSRLGMRPRPGSMFG